MPTSRLILNGNLSASNRIAREINRKLIFNQIRVNQPISRADLARTSGLQRSTVSLIVEGLVTDHWVVEGSTGEIPRGRKPTFLKINSQRGVLALDIHPSHAMLAVTDLGGEIVSVDSVKLPSDPRKVIGAILRPVQKMLRAHPDRTFEGIGITVPGRFEPRQEKSIFAPNVAWPIGDLKSRVEESTGLSVVVDNVANACALSEVWFGYSDRMHDLVVVNVSEGIGTGIFTNGNLLRGEAGVAGEFGHVQLDPNGAKCGCGGNGCWETIASNRAGMRYYAEIEKEPVSSFDDLIQLAKADHSSAKRALTKMCNALGRGMHMIALALAPGEIVVVGDITNVWELAGPAIENQMRSFPLVRAPRIRPAIEGNKARLRSAVALIMNSKMI